MKTNNVLYQYTAKKMGPFGWILIFYIITILFLLSIAMILVPIMAILRTITVWNLLFLLLCPLGGWLSIKVFHYARGLIWKNNHLTTYRFFDGIILFDEWKNIYDREPTTEQLDLATIQKVVVAPYVTNEYRTKHGGHHVDSSYIIYIIYSINAENNLLKIPFANNYENINIWLTYFQDQRVSVQFTEEVLYSYERNIYTDEERLEQLESNIHTIPLSYNGDWKQQNKMMHQNWSQEFPHDVYNIEVYGKKKNRSNPIFAMVPITSVLVGGVIFGLVELSRLGWFAADNPWPVFAVLFLISFLFFFVLRRHLRWYLMLLFVVIHFVVVLIMVMEYGERENIASQVTENALGIAMLFPFIVWIPYFIVKATRANK
ncbi:hypothetical protein [Oceanobacillus timonensis]|uniref:hypothetical protein n=1 Tax=Oceanobacillus timonensis TaxID=1926285 RepID=UPI0009BC6388|nr:hypothetical protein [Oceanobacillus timonensis]